VRHSTADNSRLDIERDGYLDLADLSVYSSLSVRFLRARLQDPVRPIPCRRVGAKILVKRSEFDIWMDTHRPVPGVDAVLAEIRSARRESQKPSAIFATVAARPRSG
jgi:hypothetical protein